jgi:uncharacterized protein (TIGR02147 family)
MSKSPFEFTDYKKFLLHPFDTTGKARGSRSKLAKALGCQTAFISQVLNGPIHFSLEHAIKICEFLGLSEDESHYFILLVHLGRAGNQALRKYYQSQIDEILHRRQVVRERIRVRQGMSKDDQATYYSTWHYAAIHVLLSVPRFQSPSAIAERLKLPFAMVSDCLEFLVSIGLAARQGENFRIGEKRIHLPSGSPLISKHHINWRMKAIQSFELPASNDLHYSSVISLSEKDARQIRSILLDSIEKAEPILKQSNEEAIFGMSMDFFRI